MFFKFAAFALPLLIVAQGMGGYASAIGARNSGGPIASIVQVSADQVGHGAETAKLASAHPVAVDIGGKDLVSSVNGPIKAMTTPTSPHTGFESLAAEQEPIFLFCTQPNCANGCQILPVSLFTPGICFSIGTFRSAAVATVGGPPPAVEVFVAEQLCDNAVQINVTDTCFNMALNGQPAEFTTFFTLAPPSTPLN